MTDISGAQNMDPSLRTVVTRSIYEIDPGLWDSVNKPFGLYWTHRFFAGIESSGIENASYWYLLFYEGQKLVATAVLSSFVVSLDLFLPRYARYPCNLIRRLFRSFLRLRILFCGVPVSIGKHTLAISEFIPPERLIRELNSRMEHICRTEGIRYLCFKEFPAGEMTAIRELDNLDYFRAHSIPRVRIDIRWRSFDEYLHSMRYGYRRQIRRSLHMLGIAEGESPLSRSSDERGDFPRLMIRNLSPQNIDRIHELYLEVMRRVETKLEILSREFFENLALKMQNDTILLCLEDRQGIQGAALLGDNDRQLNFLLVGIDYRHRDKYHTYFNLLNGIIAYAIEHRYDSIDLGQTTYHIKQRLGGKTEPVYFYLRSLSPTIQSLLSTFNRVLFPATRLRNYRVFHDSAD